MYRIALLTLTAIAAGLMVAIAVMGAPMASQAELISYLVGGGAVSLGLAAAALFWLRRGRGPLWLQMTLTYGVGVAIALVNVLLTVQAMLISHTYLPLLVVLLLFAAVSSLALGLSLAGAIGRRVAALNDGARALAAGNLAARVGVAGDDELAGLAREFNRMAEQLAAAAAERARQEGARRELVAAVSHDLRTPLASLRALVEALADGLVDDPETTRRYLGTMRGQIDLLNGLIDDLFELAQIDAGALALDLQPVAAADLVSDAITGLRPQAAARGVELRGELGAGVGMARAAPLKVERVLYNLAANAIRHTPAGGSVTLRVARDGPAQGAAEAGPPPAACILFEVADTGEGIAPEDLPHVFERFYRGEKSRSRATGGAGLGLAIARGIVEAHGGRIWIDSAVGQGTTVRFTIPAV